MACCGYSLLPLLTGSKTPCGPHWKKPNDVECFTLNACRKDITSHLRFCNTFDSDIDNEQKLLLCRAGVFKKEEIASHDNLTICPSHRNSSGVGWRCGRRNCPIPDEIAGHKSASAKGDRGITLRETEFVFFRSKILIPFGTLICRRCKTKINQLLKEKGSIPEIVLPADDQMPISSEATEILTGGGDAQKMSSDEELATQLSFLCVHDETFLPSDTTGSTASSSDDTSDRKKSKLNDFLVECNIEPLGRPWIDWNKASEKTRQRYTVRACDVVYNVLSVMYPGQSNELWYQMKFSAVMDKLTGVSKLSKSDVKFLKAMSEAYENVSTWDSRRQILSIMTGIATYKDLLRFIPRLTQYRFTTANLHRLQYGRGTPVEVKPVIRLRIERKQLDHFLAFITSPHIVQDLPFGEKKLKLSSGEVLTVPNAIRTIIPQHIVRQYKQYCAEINFKPFSESTMIRILLECSASVRKSLQGLDYFAAEGARGFEDLDEVLEKLLNLGACGNEVSNLQECLKAGKQYLKGDYKVHVSENSRVPSHCSVHALSDATDKDHRKACDHAHDERCPDCEALESTLVGIESLLSTVTFANNDDHDEAAYLCQKGKQSIIAWKCHLLRSINQDKARLEAIEQLDDHTILVINDWAMKFLPQYYRESQTDWFGKRGISWHISVVYRRSKGVLQSQVFIHVIQTCTQGSAAVVLLLQHVNQTLRNEHPEITKCFFHQDNAGCYHSNNTILACPAIEKSTGVKVQRMDFCDPQGGKGAADRMAATAKNHIRIFINEGNDVTNAQQMKSALLSHGGIHGVRVAVADQLDEVSIEQPKIQGISKLNNFSFYNGTKVTASRAHNIGRGKSISVNVTTDKYPWLHDVSFSPGDFKDHATKRVARSAPPEQQGDHRQIPQSSLPSSSEIFACPQEGCVRVFQRYSSLEKHLSFEKCIQYVERQTLMDQTKIGYASRLQEGIGQRPAIQSKKIDSTDEVAVSVGSKEGWALRENKKSTRFNETQKEYLLQKFNIGQTTGKKAQAEAVARDMRRAKGPDGKRLFSVPEFLSPQQISSYFSRLASKAKKGQLSQEDIQAIEEEATFDNARQHVLSSLQEKHPIVLDQYNICEMISKGTLTKLKVGLLQHICESFDLNMPPNKPRKKAPYVSLIEELVSQCSCASS